MSPSHIVRTLPLVVLAALMSSACVHHVHRHPTRGVQSTPPSWAPAHGHRRVHQDLTLVFDGNLGCYAISGHSHHFFHRDHYYRFQLGQWERAPRFSGPWRRVQRTVLPPGLRRWRARTPETRIDRRIDRRRAERDRTRERREHQHELARAQAEARLEQERAERAHRLEMERQRQKLARQQRELDQQLARQQERLRKPRRPERPEPAEQRGREEREAEKRSDTRLVRRGKKGKDWRGAH